MIVAHNQVHAPRGNKRKHDLKKTRRGKKKKRESRVDWYGVKDTQKLTTRGCYLGGWYITLVSMHRILRNDVAPVVDVDSVLPMLVTEVLRQNLHISRQHNQVNRFSLQDFFHLSFPRGKASRASEKTKGTARR